MSLDSSRSSLRLTDSSRIPSLRFTRHLYLLRIRPLLSLFSCFFRRSPCFFREASCNTESHQHISFPFISLLFNIYYEPVKIAFTFSFNCDSTLKHMKYPCFLPNIGEHTCTVNNKDRYLCLETYVKTFSNANFPIRGVPHDTWEEDEIRVFQACLAKAVLVLCLYSELVLASVHGIVFLLCSQIICVSSFTFSPFLISTENCQIVDLKVLGPLETTPTLTLRQLRSPDRLSPRNEIWSPFECVRSCGTSPVLIPIKK